MRYYRIVITDPKTGVVVQPPGFAGLLSGATYASFANGQTLASAWDVELDVPVIDAATSQGFALLRIWGISAAEIAQANDLTGKNIAVYGGMQKGLPLANPALSGLLVSGTILQCFGNWIDVDMTLDFVIAPGTATATVPGGTGSVAKPRNITLNWQGGQPLGPAIKTALQAAFPGFIVNVAVSANLVRPQGDSPVGFYSTLGQFAQNMKEVSRAIVREPSYAGVSMLAQGNTITVFDGSAAATGKPVAIAYQDLIGQPTWIESPNIQFKAVMRADLAVGREVTLPPTQIRNSQQAASWIVNQKVSFQGGFTIYSLRHCGRFRQPTADAWVTIVEAYPNQLAPAGA